MKVKEKQEDVKERFIEAYHNSRGNISKACNVVGISRTTFYNYWKDDDDFKLKCDEVIESQIDYVEGRLIDKISDGDITGIIYYLKTRGASRGWGQKSEVTHNVNEIKTIELIEVGGKLLPKNNLGLDDSDLSE